MHKMERRNSGKPVAVWLLVGVFMIIVQIILGGITRLTESGLSITEWKPILGTLPPLNEREWTEAFNQYKKIAQFKNILIPSSVRGFMTLLIRATMVGGFQRRISFPMFDFSV